MASEAARAGQKLLCARGSQHLLWNMYHDPQFRLIEVDRPVTVVEYSKFCHEWYIFAFPLMSLLQHCCHSKYFPIIEFLCGV